ncbi:hypothetical protein OQA88_887 [Cercophora sp. LCS_1]
MSRFPSIDDAVDHAQTYIGPLQHYQALIETRQQAEVNLLQAYHELIQAYRAKCEEAERERRNARLWEREQAQTEREFNRLRLDVESYEFAYVIIDGDGAIFREDLIVKGEDGGQEAADELHKQLKAHLHENHLASNIDIFVQVVLSIEGLSKALYNSGILTDDRTALAKFARGFSKAQPLFSFVDIGFGKEQADHTVKKTFEVMTKTVQCRTVILAGCHDNGYATYLSAFRGNNKVELLETTPAEAGFDRVPFNRIKFPTVFRSQPLASTRADGNTPPSRLATTPVTKTVALSVKPAASTSPKVANATLETRKEAGNSWATVSRLAVAPVIDVSTKKVQPKVYIAKNRNNERLDVPIPRVNPEVTRSLDEKKNRNGANFCNKYHILGFCRNEASGRCPYVHGDRLKGAELDALRLRARALQCGSGYACEDPWCISGHHCANPKACFYDEDCRFYETHGMDMTPTIKIYEDGHREVLKE